MTQATTLETEVVTVLCPTDTLVCRVRRPVGQLAGGELGACVEVPCRGCRAAMLKAPAYRTLRRNELAVYHFVDPTEARIVDTLMILYPRPGANDANHGGREVPNATYEAALKLVGF